MMKRCWIYLAAIMALTMLLALPVSAEPIRGACGEFAFWEFDEATGTLTISGEGTVDGGADVSYTSPWHHWRKQILQLVIGDEITEIKMYAFSDLPMITSVVLPSKMENLWSNAFYKCTSLKDLYFEGFPSMKGFEHSLHHSLNVHFDYSNTAWRQWIIDYPREEFDKLRINVEPMNSPTSGTCGTNNSVSYVLEDGTLTVTGSGSLKLNLPTCLRPWHEYRHQIHTLIFSGNIHTIGWGQVCLPALKNVTLPEQLTIIEFNAFEGCTSLETITIPDTVKRICDYAFAGCTSLKEVKFPANLEQIDRLAFKNCTSLEQIQLPGKLKYLSLNVFDNCGLRTVTIPASVKNMGPDVFVRCAALESIYFTGNMPQIDPRLAGSGTTNTVTVYYPEGNSTWTAAKMQSTGQESFGFCPVWVAIPMGNPSPAPDPTVPSGNTQTPPVTESEETLPEESATEPSSEPTETTDATDATDATQDSDPTDPESTGIQQPTQTPPADNGSAVPQLNTTDKIVIVIGLVAVALLPGVVSFLVVSKLRGRSRR